MPKYTATDNTTGKSVSFEWHAAEPPTDADLEEVFAEARTAAPAEPERTWTDTAVDALPFVGGMIGGIVSAPTGPGAIGGAALGAAGGEGWRQVINRARGKGGPATMTEAAGDIATQGAVSAASELTGMGLAKGGRAVYRGLLKPSKALRDSFGGADIVDTLVKEGATISDPGVAKMTGRLGASRDAAMDIVRAADATATPVTPREATRHFKGIRGELRKRADIGQPNQVGAVARRAKQIKERFTGPRESRLQKVDFRQRAVPKPSTGQVSFTQYSQGGPRAASSTGWQPRDTMSAAVGRFEGANPERGLEVVRGDVLTRPSRTGVSLMEAQALKETAQDAASGAYRAMDRGVVKQLSPDDLMDTAVARGLREAIETRAPAVAPQNARTQALLGGTRALEDAVERGKGNLAIGGARDLIAAGTGGLIGASASGNKEGAASGAITAGLLMRLLSSPRSGSLAAIGMDRASRVTPDALRALAALMSTHEEQ